MKIKLNNFKNMKRNDFIYSQEDLRKIDSRKNSIYVFLAGPIKGATNWRETDFPEIDGVIYLNPCRNLDVDKLAGDAFTEQVDWETLGLRMADIVVFWIPKSIPGYNEPGRFYAQTTKFELAENLTRFSKKRLVIGIDPSIEMRPYITEKVKNYKPDIFVHSTIDYVISNLKDEVERIKKISDSSNTNYFFTSDTHFGSSRTFELSKRPFFNVNDMDLSMVERWNSVVSPFSTVYHLGDFGDLKWVPYLNGNIILIRGNYEDKILDEELLKSGISKVYYDETVGFLSVPAYLSHIQKLGDNSDFFSLYGHIHGRQAIRRNGLNVGVDAHNYTPISAYEVNWFINAIKNHYDSDVFGDKKE